MTLTRELTTAVRMTLVLWLITAIAYPLLIWGIGQVAFPTQANGSLIQNDQGEVVGSALIGQPFSGDQYFLSRPSGVDYSVGDAAVPTGVSGASNLAPGNPDLVARIRADHEALRAVGIAPTADLVYASGSGLDPHITPEAAQAQVARVAAARAIDPSQLQPLIQDATEGRFWGIWGEPGVNVLRLNLALEQWVDRNDSF